MGKLRKVLFAAIVLTIGMAWIRILENPKLRTKAPAIRYPALTISPTVIRHMKERTVLISAEGWNGIERGTGILVDSKHVLTCAHVAKAENDELWVYTYPLGKVYRAKPEVMDSSKDLAILVLDNPVHITQRAIFEPAHYDGEPITIIGNALGSMKWFVSYGIISGSGGEYVYTDGTVVGGNSGGPWIDSKGGIVAISDWGLENSRGAAIGINGGVDAKTIVEFIKKWRNYEDDAPPQIRMGE